MTTRAPAVLKRREKSSSLNIFVTPFLLLLGPFSARPSPTEPGEIWHPGGIRLYRGQAEEGRDWSRAGMGILASHVSSADQRPGGLWINALLFTTNNFSWRRWQLNMRWTSGCLATGTGFARIRWCPAHHTRGSWNRICWLYLILDLTSIRYENLAWSLALGLRNLEPKGPFNLPILKSYLAFWEPNLAY